MAEQSRELDGTQSEVAAKKTGALTAKLVLDVSDAITGLKAVTREAKKATAAIRELETYYERDDKQYYVKWRQQGEDCTDIREVCMTDIPTEYLRRELAKRQPDLSELLAGITEDNRHEVVDFIQRSYD